MSRRKILVADLLCGAGGSSTGCARALAELGLEMELVCVNHWGIAIETHKKNHPLARHYCEDIAAVRPHIIVPEGYLDLLMASPTCTHHSVARGGKPTSDQQRSDPWHIITWLTELRVKRLIIENVWEFVGWGPVDPRTGKPIKSRKGEYFALWIDTIRRLGFEPEWRKLNAANYGDATTRQRFILKARNDRKIVAWAPLTHAKRADDTLLFPGMKPWKPAREIIDWSLKGRSIFNRSKPLAPKTLARIYAGAVKFNWPEPFLVVLRNHMDGQSLDRPLPTVAANGLHMALAEPILLKQNFRRDAQTVDDPAPTVMTQARIGLAEPIVCGNRTNNTAKSVDEPVGGITTTTGGGQFFVEPVIINGRKNNKAKGVSSEPAPTLDTKGGVWLAEPLVLSTGSGAARPADDPLPTITTGGAGSDDPGCARPMLVSPVISFDQMMAEINGSAVEPFILNRHGDGFAETRAHSIGDPAPTANCDGGGYLVEPFVLSRHAGGAPRSVEEPTPTQVAKQSHVLISPYYGSGSGETCKSAEEPLDTVTSKGRFGMVVPVTHTQGGNAARDVADPLPTLTTAKGGEFAMVMPVTHHDHSDRVRDLGEPIPTVTTAARGELAFIAAQFGEREGQAPRVHDIAEPTPAITATGHVNLVEATPQYDILFRMLEPHELAAAMGFNEDEAEYEFAGTKTQKIKQIGNAVSVSLMKAEVAAIMADAAAKAKPEPAIVKRAASA
ncbi:DNA cytosine methyltransferase [Bradyrhizobium embrapense]|uniref:DNA cytosine methyltransferase n=1 Tax=Bradyrhizobium embrapense TaxID=630921 RepID=UPI0007C54B78|nr:DNA cytosine methyltransferase [Bradyrhizobium embrapense]